MRCDASRLPHSTTRLCPSPFTALPNYLSTPPTTHKKAMSDSPTHTPAHRHEPPSLPNSPLPKRTRVIDPTPFSQSATLPRGTDSGAATPTPLANIGPNMASLQPPAQIAPSIAAAAAAEQQLQVLLLSDKATAPTKGSAYAAGHDLYSAKDMTIPARGRALVGTDISISVPVGTCMFPACSRMLNLLIRLENRWQSCPALRTRLQARH